MHAQSVKEELRRRHTAVARQFSSAAPMWQAAWSVDARTMEFIEADCEGYLLGNLYRIRELEQEAGR